MPVRYEFDGDVFRLVMEGTYSAEEIGRVFLTAFEDPAFPHRPLFVFDVSRSEELATRSANQIIAVALFLSEHAERIGGRCAVVVSKPVQHGLARIGAALAATEGVEVRVFTAEQDALAWLGTPQ